MTGRLHWKPFNRPHVYFLPQGLSVTRVTGVQSGAVKVLPFPAFVCGCR
jgi:hypothetical protein